MMIAFILIVALITIYAVIYTMYELKLGKVLDIEGVNKGATYILITQRSSLEMYAPISALIKLYLYTPIHYFQIIKAKGNSDVINKVIVDTSININERIYTRQKNA